MNGFRRVALLNDNTEVLWRSDNIRTLYNSEATQRAVLTALADLARDAQPGDTVVYTHSSHGAVLGRETVLCCHNTYYTDTELADALRLFKPGVDVIVIVNACRSGGLFDNDGYQKSLRTAAGKPWSETFIANVALRSGAAAKALDTPGIAFMVATLADEDGYMGSIGSGHSMYFEELIDACSESSANVDGDNFLQFMEIHNRAARKINGYHLGGFSFDTQHPQCFNEKLLGRVAVRPAPPAKTQWYYNLANKIFSSSETFSIEFNTQAADAGGTGLEITGTPAAPDAPTALRLVEAGNDGHYSILVSHCHISADSGILLG